MPASTPRRLRHAVAALAAAALSLATPRLAAAQPPGYGPLARHYDVAGCFDTRICGVGTVDIWSGATNWLVEWITTLTFLRPGWIVDFARPEPLLCCFEGRLQRLTFPSCRIDRLGQRLQRFLQLFLSRLRRGGRRLELRALIKHAGEQLVSLLSFGHAALASLHLGLGELQLLAGRSCRFTIRLELLNPLTQGGNDLGIGELRTARAQLCDACDPIGRGTRLSSRGVQVAHG